MMSLLHLQQHLILSFFEGSIEQLLYQMQFQHMESTPDLIVPDLIDFSQNNERSFRPRAPVIIK